MSHAIYQTRALVLKTKNMRESNKLITLYTKRFGLIYAAVQSVRKLESKMRFHVHTLSIVDIDLVEGRDIWRITGIHEYHPSHGFAGTSWYELADRIAHILMRLCAGEEPHEQLWKDISSLYILIHKHQDTEAESHQVIELIMISRTLYHLGYWEGEELFIHDPEPFSPACYKEVLSDKKKIMQKINQGIQDSQL